MKTDETQPEMNDEEHTAWELENLRYMILDGSKKDNVPWKYFDEAEKQRSLRFLRRARALLGPSADQLSAAEARGRRQAFEDALLKCGPGAKHDQLWIDEAAREEERRIGRREALEEFVRENDSRRWFLSPDQRAWLWEQRDACGPGAKAEAVPEAKTHGESVLTCWKCGSTDLRWGAKEEAQPAEQPAPALAVDPLTTDEREAVVRTWLDRHKGMLAKDEWWALNNLAIDVIEAQRQKVRPATLPTVEALATAISDVCRASRLMADWEFPMRAAMAVLARLGAQPSTGHELTNVVIDDPLAKLAPIPTVDAHVRGWVHAVEEINGGCEFTLEQIDNVLCRAVIKQIREQRAKLDEQAKEIAALQNTLAHAKCEFSPATQSPPRRSFSEMAAALADLADAVKAEREAVRDHITRAEAIQDALKKARDEGYQRGKGDAREADSRRIAELEAELLQVRETMDGWRTTAGKWERERDDYRRRAEENAQASWPSCGLRRDCAVRASRCDCGRCFTWTNRANSHRPNERTHAMNNTKGQPIIETVTPREHRPDIVGIAVQNIGDTSYGGSLSCPTLEHATALEEYLRRGRIDPETGRVWCAEDGE